MIDASKAEAMSATSLPEDVAAISSLAEKQPLAKMSPVRRNMTLSAQSPYYNDMWQHRLAERAPRRRAQTSGDIDMTKPKNLKMSYVARHFQYFVFIFFVKHKMDDYFPIFFQKST